MSLEVWRVCLGLLAGTAAFSFPLFAFFSFRYWIKGVVVTFSFPLLVPLPCWSTLADFGTGFVRLSRNSMNSGSWSMVPWRASLRTLVRGALPYGANSTEGGPRSAGSLEVFLASLKVAFRTLSDKALMYSDLVKFRYALDGFEGFAGLVIVSSWYPSYKQQGSTL